MLQRVFTALVRLHPHRFRGRFEAELLEAYELGVASLGARRLLWDAIRSLFRQWLLRPPLPPEHVHVTPAGDTFSDIPGVTQLVRHHLGPSAIAFGAVLAVGSFGALQFATNHWGGEIRVVVGAFRRAVGLPLAHVGNSDRAAAVGVDRPTDSFWDDVAENFLKQQRLLRALDTDGNYRFERTEIAGAGELLSRLDRNRNGILEAFECTEEVQAEDALNRILVVLRGNPILRQLDADQNGEISEHELREAARVLSILDVSHDGQLHPVEYLPIRTVNRALMK
jgi:hypothetical protein